MQTEQPERQYTAEENAVAAAHWRELCAKVRECLDDTPNGYSSIWGGDDNISVQMLSQRRGFQTLRLTLNWTVDSEHASDFNFALKPPQYG